MKRLILTLAITLMLTIPIQADEKPLPRKILIDYKNRSGRPQFEAILSDWNLSASRVSTRRRLSGLWTPLWILA